MAGGLPAARLGDPIAHSLAMAGLIAGAIIGIVIGVAIITTGGLALGAVAAAASVASGSAFGATVLQTVGSLFSPIKSGLVVGGSSNVRVNSLPAARTIGDFGDCSGTLFTHFSRMSAVAQGSTSVFINGQPAARKGDALQCGAKIKEGSINVFIGNPENGTYLAVDAEVPVWLSNTLTIVSLLGGAGLLRFGMKLTWSRTAFVLFAGFAGSKGGGLAGHELGGRLFGQGSIGQQLLGFTGSILGGILAGRWATNYKSPFLGRTGSEMMDARPPGYDFRQVGRQGEMLVQRTQNLPASQTRITVNGRGRIIDFMNPNRAIMAEVKNVQTLSLTQQIRDFAAHAQRNGLEFQLFTNKTTTMSGPLQSFMQQAGRSHHFIPSGGSQFLGGLGGQSGGLIEREFFTPIISP